MHVLRFSFAGLKDTLLNSPKQVLWGHKWHERLEKLEEDGQLYTYSYDYGELKAPQTCLCSSPCCFSRSIRYCWEEGICQEKVVAPR